jgi:streptogramin lyase
MLTEVKHYIIYFSVLFVSVLLTGISSFAQNKTTAPTNFPEPMFEHITMADGLPDASVRAILQDRLGYLWLGTQNGLVKYDGYEMTVYKPDPDDPRSISHHQIRSIYEDRSGTLWIGTGMTESGGLNRFDRQSETFTRYMHDPDDSTTINANFVGPIYEGGGGDLLVVTVKGLNLFDRTDETFQSIHYDASTYPPAVYEYLHSLMAKKKPLASILHVGNNQDLTTTFTVEKQTPVIVVIMDEAGYDSGWLENATGEIVAGHPDDDVMCAGGYVEYQIQIVLDTLDRGQYRLRYVSDVANSYNSWGRGRTWGERISPPDYPEFWGIQVIELAEDPRVIHELLDEKQTVPLETKVWPIMEDQVTRNILVGSSSRLLIYDTEKRTLTDYVENVGFGGEIASLQQAEDGTIWIGHTMGVSKFNSQRNSIKLYQPTFSASYLHKNHFGGLIVDNKGLIWTSDYKGLKWPSFGGSGLISFNPQVEEFKTYRHDPDNLNSISSNILWAGYKDRSGILWVGTGWAGLNKWDQSKHKFSRFGHDPSDPERKHFYHVRQMAEGTDGMIWFGTADGLYSFDRSSTEFRNYKYDVHEKDNRVVGTHIDGSGIVWFTTSGRGLGRFDPARGGPIRSIPTIRTILLLSVITTPMTFYQMQMGIYG